MMKPIKLILTIIITIAFLAESTGVGYALRPPAERCSGFFQTSPEISSKQMSEDEHSVQKKPSRAKKKKNNILNINRLNLETLKRHLSSLDSLKDLDAATIDKLAKWIIEYRPYRNRKLLKKALQGTGIKGVKKHHQEAIANLVKTGTTRRQLLVRLGIGGLITYLIVRLASFLSYIKSTETRRSEIRQAYQTMRKEKKMLGDFLKLLIEEQGIKISKKDSEYLAWKSFLQALNISDWTEAAMVLYNSNLYSLIEGSSRHTFVSVVFYQLKVTQDAINFVNHDEEAQKYKVFIAYKFGAFPAIGTAPFTIKKGSELFEKIADYDEKLKAAEKIFRKFEVINSINQKPAHSSEGAPIRIAQGHNMSYAHARNDLTNPKIFKPGRRRILVNWDAHADMRTPFEIFKISLKQLKEAKTSEKIIELASFMSIAGWILPLFYHGFLSHEQGPMEMIWVIPKEAQNYLTKKEKGSIYADIVWELHYDAQTETLDIKNAMSLEDFEKNRDAQNSDTKKFIVHIMDPDDINAITKVIGDAEVFLSVDADYSGTTVMGADFFYPLAVTVLGQPDECPYYPLNQTLAEEARHEQLIGRLGDFYVRCKDQIKSASIVYSPNFTADEERRRPIAKILRKLIGNSIRKQPEWVKDEFERIPPPEKRHFLKLILDFVGKGTMVGIGLLAGGLMWHYRRALKVKKMSAEEKKWRGGNAQKSENTSATKGNPKTVSRGNLVNELVNDIASTTHKISGEPDAVVPESKLTIPNPIVFNALSTAA